MSKIVWSEKLAIGVPLIDEQHRQIIDLINTLQENIERGELTRAEQTLSALVEHKIAHCAYEETLLQKSGFPFLKPHKKAHHDYIEECRAYMQRMQQGDYILPKALSFIKPWMVRHIRGEDQDYAHFVREHIAQGAKPVEPWHMRTLNRFFPNRGQ